MRSGRVAATALAAGIVAAVFFWAFGAARLGLGPSSSAAAAEPAPAPGPSAPKPPPLVVDPNAPLLLDDAPAEKPPTSRAAAKADNEACFVCHANYREEPLVVEHAKENIGCVKCHGSSLKHRNDENNVTPPDVMFPLDAIDDGCADCHDEHVAPAVKVIARWQERCPEKNQADSIVCTDCHGNHRLELRTVRWNKKTGELLSRQAIPPTERGTP